MTYHDPNRASAGARLSSAAQASDAKKYQYDCEKRRERSPHYEDVILVKGDYRIILGRETRHHARQFIVQCREGGKYRNLSYHLNWNSISFRYGAWLMGP